MCIAVAAYSAGRAGAQDVPRAAAESLAVVRVNVVRRDGRVANVGVRWGTR